MSFIRNGLKYYVPFRRLNASSFRNTLHPKIPKGPVCKEFDQNALPEATKIDMETIRRMEKLALVDFANQEGIDRLSEAIRIADQITLADTTGVDPMYSLHEDRSLYLRDDVVTEGGNVKEIIQNAAKTCEDDYFVAPSGGHHT